MSLQVLIVFVMETRDQNSGHWPLPGERDKVREERDTREWKEEEPDRTNKGLDKETIFYSRAGRTRQL